MKQSSCFTLRRPVKHDLRHLFHVCSLVWIHPFPNGNGRHARLFTDIFLTTFKHERFTWGRANLTNPSQTREAYIKALKQADSHDYGP
ncbi:MAG: Mobile mystery protein B [uncultured bacterium]|nr:MAG: Mobile mystery protein B [uncultured bacterium]HBG34726.1 hypothetical protein [Holosporales bacterium]HBW24953.1 hypothetical protein [Holosporales bacterium]HCC25409.1 hypothetical protein [Holosporales bacterium]HCE96541.1 hypothetical protein [Holosporales bacterium]